MRPISTLPAAVLLLVCIAPASATPLLQLYVEGATYNFDEESWEFTADSAGIVPIRLWAIGNVAGPGGKGTIYDVKLSVAFDASVGDVGVTFVSSTTGGYGNFTDGTIPQAAVLNTDLGTNGLVTDGSTPTLSDGSPLPSHGEYGPGTYWKEYELGDFIEMSSPVADFIGSFPALPSGAPLQGQINVYEITFQKNTSLPVRVHFDLYNHTQSGNKAKYWFAPFSHDGDATGSVVPEPSSLAMLGLGVLGMACASLSRLRPWRPASVVV